MELRCHLIEAGRNAKACVGIKTVLPFELTNSRNAAELLARNNLESRGESKKATHTIQPVGNGASG